MWYQRFVSWLRSLFTTSSEVNAQPAPLDSEAPTLPMTAPLREPFGAWDENMALPPPMVEFPVYREPPSTVPLARLAHPSQPLTSASMGVDDMGMGRLGWASHEPSQPSQPIQSSQPTQPLSEAPQPRPIEPAWLDAEPEDASEIMDDMDNIMDSMDGVDDEAPDIEPGSDLFQRLMLLRRLVRQRVYNEGFAPDATPEQYLRYSSQDDRDAPFDAR